MQRQLEMIPDSIQTAERPYGGATFDASAAFPWLVVRAKRHRERLLHAALTHAEVTSYLPLMRHWPRPAVGSDVGPLFPGYVFCRPDYGRYHLVERCRGARGIVSFGNGPATVGQDVIDFLRERAGEDGIITVDGPPTGREVTITAGPLRGLEAVVACRLPARDRVVVLLDLMQRELRVELPERWVRAT